MKRSFLLVATGLIVLAMAAPANALALFGEQDQSGSLGIRITQNTFDNDQIDLYGLTTETDFTQVSQSGQDLARNVLDDLNISRQKATVDTPYYDDVSDDDHGDAQVVIDLHDPIFSRLGDELSLDVNTASLLATARNYGFNELELGVCTATATTDRSSTQAPEKSGKCYWWTQPTSNTNTAVHIKLVQAVSASGFWNLVGVLFIVSVILSMIAVALGMLLRRRAFKVLNTGALVTALCVTGLAWGMSFIAAFAIGSSPAAQKLLLIESTTHFLAATFMASLLLAIPGVVLAAMLATLPPAPLSVRPTSFGGAPMPPTHAGVPTWLNNQPASAPQQWQQQPSWQTAPQPQQQWQQAQQPQPSQPQPPQQPQTQQPQPQAEESGEQTETQPPSAPPPPPPPPPGWSPPA